MANKENIQKWVDALRSGEYEQTKGGLRHTNGSSYCCLGVACDISGIGEWIEYTNSTGWSYEVNGYTNSVELPHTIAEWLGLDKRETNVPLDVKIDDYEVVDAIALNDEHDYTFNQIADEIERTYLND